MSKPPYPSRVWYAADLSGDRLVLGRVERTRRGPRHSVLEAPSGSAAATPVGPAAPCAACLPIHQSLVRWIRAPLGSVSKALKVLPSQLDIQLPFPLEECAAEFLGVGPAGSGTVEGLAVVARHTDIAQRLEHLRERGLDPVVLDHEGLALWTESLVELPPERDAVRLVAAIEPSRMALASGRAGAAEYGRLFGAHCIRPLPEIWSLSGLGADHPAVQNVLGRLRQVLHALPAETAGLPIEWIWTGVEAEDETAVKEWELLLKDLAPFSFRRHEQPSSFLARALAARALQGGPWTCNLRAGTFLHPLLTSHRAGQYRQGTIILAAAGLFLCALGLGWPALLDARNRAAQDLLQRTAAPLAGLSPLPRGQEVLLARRALEERTAAAGPLFAAFDPAMERLLVDVLREAGRNAITLESLALAPDAVALRGASTDWDRCERMAEPFRQRGYSVQVERQEAGLDELVHFSLRGGRAP